MTATPRSLDFVGSLQDRAAALRQLYLGTSRRLRAVHEREHIIGAPGEIALGPEWTAGDPPPRYLKDPDGLVYLFGRVNRNSSVLGGFLCNLPSGYRPTWVASFLVNIQTENVAGVETKHARRLTVDTNGDVSYHGRYNFPSLDGIRFWTD